MYRPEYEKSIKSVSEKLKIPSEWLKRLLRFESNYNPQAKNKVSSASGLIQFTDTTSRGLGYKNAQDLIQSHKTFTDQLSIPVYNYLKKQAPFVSEIDFYMAVFYPAYRKVSPLKRFPDNVIRDNPGIVRPLDYFNKVIAASNGLFYNGLRYIIYGVAVIFMFTKIKKWSFKNGTTKKA